MHFVSMKYHTEIDDAETIPYINHHAGNCCYCIYTAGETAVLTSNIGMHAKLSKYTATKSTRHNRPLEWKQYTKYTRWYTYHGTLITIQHIQYSIQRSFQQHVPILYNCTTLPTSLSIVSCHTVDLTTRCCTQYTLKK